MSKKISIDYTKQIGGNLDEKIQPWKEYIESNLISDLRILDIGSAGGEFISELNQIISKQHEIWGIDTSDTFVSMTSNLIGERAVKGNACNMPFEDNFFDAINASSLLHEVSSYGYEGIFGLEAVDIALREVARILKPGGFFFYRDVLAPKDRNECKRHYSKCSQTFFIDLFLFRFCNTPPDFYKDKYTIVKESESYVITGSNFLHREVQKHYLLCLQNISNYLDSVTPNKQVNTDKLDRLLFLEKTMSREALTNPEALGQVVGKWLEREGEEKYLYLSPDELIQRARDIADNQGYVLVPVIKEGEGFRYIRKQETIFLRDIMQHPEEEGKQVILFKKTLAKPD